MNSRTTITIYIVVILMYFPSISLLSASMSVGLIVGVGHIVAVGVGEGVGVGSGVIVGVGVGVATGFRTTFSKKSPPFYLSQH